MKTIKIIPVLLFSLAFMLVGNSAIAKGKYEKVTIQTSAVCEMCKERIEAALLETEGIRDAVLDMNSKNAKVKFDPEVITEAEVKQVIANTGYNADDVEANEEAYHALPGCCQKEGVCTH